MPIDPQELMGLDPELRPIQELPPARRGRLVRGKLALRIVSTFFLGQGALQGLQLISALFLIRALSVDSYAQFGLALGFQATVGTLMDLGFSSTIIPLVGDRVDDRALVGRYVRAAKHLRDRTFWIIAPFAAIAFLAVMSKHHWDWKVQVLLLASVLVTLYSSGAVSYNSAPLFLFGRLRGYYAPQTFSALGRLVAYVGLRTVGALNSWTAAGLNAVNTVVNGKLLGRESRECIDWPKEEDPATDREIIRYMLPAAPAIVFAAFQSQISLFLISIFGQTVNIAQVAALSKIGQLFAVLMTFNIVVVEPYIARLGRHRLGSTYLALLALAAVACVPVVLIAFFLPTPFLWLLGAKYSGLSAQVGWVVLTACINYLAGLVWIMNRARKWLFWSGTFLEIVLILAVQIAFVVFAGVHTTRDAVMFGFASSCCYVVAHGYVAIYGFLRGPRV
jgi:O-antigen/teichoic acid export membrane protein